MSFSQSRQVENTKDTYFILSTGLLLSKSQVIDPHRLLKTKYIEGFSVKATYQSQFRKTLYWEASLSCNEYWIGYKINDNNPIFLGYAISAFLSLESNLSLVYKVQTKNRREIINLHFGLSIGSAFSSKGITGNIGYINEQKIDYIISELEGTVRQQSLLIISNSMGISKDFRITDKLDMGLSFNFNFGYNKLTQIDMKYKTYNASGIKPASATLNGTSFQSLIYLRYKISNTN